MVDEHTKADKGNGKLISFREEKLNSIGFVWSKRYNWKVMFRFEILQRKRGEVADSEIRQRTSERWCWQMANQC